MYSNFKKLFIKDYNPIKVSVCSFLVLKRLLELSQASKSYLEDTLREILTKIEMQLKKTPKVDNPQQSIENWVFWLKSSDLVKTSEYQTLFGLIFKKAYDKKSKSLNLLRVINIAIIVAIDFFQDALDFSELDEKNAQILFKEIKEFIML